MNVPLLVTGCLLVLVALVDAVVTTLSLVKGAGPLTGRLADAVWKTMVTAHRRRGGSGKVLQWSGTCTLLATFALWTTLLWAGWWCFFGADGAAVVSSTTAVPADAWSRAYFTGYTLFTLGIGDYVPGTAWAQGATVVATLSGLFVVTLAITYFLQVVQAVVHKREFAQQVHALGADGAEIVTGGWTDDGFTPMFNQHLVSLTAPLLRMGEQHMAFPVVHFFHSPAPRKAPACAVDALDDALLLLCAGVARSSRADPAATGPLRSALGEVLRTLRIRFFAAAERPQPVTPLRRLRDAGVPVAGEDAYAEAVREHARVRREVRGYLHSDGWERPEDGGEEGADRPDAVTRGR
ncbi:potassium channel family protein [Streptomyces sp. TRM 70351]|uniref:potassium channel family protein n=1 Tax=Streptomyces sp. TRM 70351 TaxID=3116552 RepID=UPI002E7AFE52|nr:potassium channel family protein [Streptomyces sp. TRM 70351]MEE1926975.1 potassium channel family protein [Streptomyces sp. TRM 70351]